MLVSMSADFLKSGTPNKPQHSTIIIAIDIVTAGFRTDDNQGRDLAAGHLVRRRTGTKTSVIAGA
jgi:hypothetical protein